MTAVGLAEAAGGPVAPSGGTAGPAPAPGRRPRGAALRWVAAVVVAAAVATAAGYGVVAATSGPARQEVLGPGDVTVQVDVEHSLFAPDRLRVAEGTRVRFVVVNGDPLHHELIVGPPDVHARHAEGTEAEHPSIPGEVSVDLNATAVTTYTFDEPGTVEFACHLPGHYEHGMRGTVEVVPDA